jgi:GH25 family lysozyme M1 (1,4-beta-N-acetylmuramidase)
MAISRRTFLKGAVGLAAVGAIGPQAAAQTAGTLPGIDVSHWQGTINWNSVFNAGIRFAFTKATEGTGYLDPQLSRNLSEMSRLGIVRGAYHFGHPNVSATSQAQYFVSNVKKANGGTVSGCLQLCLDLEVTDGQAPAQVWSWTQSFIAEVKSLTGRPGIIYTSPSFWTTSVGNPTSNLNCPLWIAHWNVATPTVPRAWSSVGWAFWQYTSTGSVSGVTGNVDRDRFRNGGSYPNVNALVIP